MAAATVAFPNSSPSLQGLAGGHDGARPLVSRGQELEVQGERAGDTITDDA